MTEKYKPYINEYKANHLAYNNRKKDSEINDFYATEPKAVEDLLKVESFSKQILEPAVGMGAYSKCIRK